MSYVNRLTGDLYVLGAYNGQMLPYPSIDANAGNGIVQGIPLASSKPVGSTPIPKPQMDHSSSVNADGVNMTASCAPRHSGVGIKVQHEHYVSLS